MCICMCPLIISIPILKNKNGDTSAKNNYRPIAIVTAMSKIFELCLSRIMDAYCRYGSLVTSIRNTD